MGRTKIAPMIRERSPEAREAYLQGYRAGVEAAAARVTLHCDCTHADVPAIVRLLAYAITPTPRLTRTEAMDLLRSGGPPPTGALASAEPPSPTAGPGLERVSRGGGK